MRSSIVCSFFTCRPTSDMEVIVLPCFAAVACVGFYQNWHCDGGSAVARQRRAAMFEMLKGSMIPRAEKGKTRAKPQDWAPVRWSLK